MYTIEQDQEPVEPAALQQQSDEEQGTIEALRDACAALRMRNRALASSLRQATVAANEAGHRAERLRLESAAAIRQLVLQNDQLRHGMGQLRSAMLAQEVARKTALAAHVPDALGGGGTGCWHDVHVRRLADALPGLEKAAIQDDSLGARELLARIATEGRHGWSETVALFGCGDAGRSLPPRADALAAMARVMSNRPPDGFDELSALWIYEALLAGGSEGVFSPADRIRHVELLARHGARGRAAMRLAASGLAHDLPADHAALWANLVHADEEGEWLGALNGVFGTSLEPVALSAGQAPRLDRIRCRPGGLECAEGPLVSVLMTVYQAGHLVDTAVRSVLAQTWRNIELIIVDDCSDDGTGERLRLLAERDPRVRVLRTGCNSGTYVARNLALREARGMFVTCHDADDWSHPRKIERQVRHLLEKPERAGNLSSWMRTSDELVLQRFSATGRYLYPNTSSLMFRRVPVLEALGGWDAVRMGADSEFYKRIEVVFKQKLEVLGDAPLSFGRMRNGALTSGTLGRGWASPERRLYRDSWRAWHKRVAAGQTGARMTPGADRPFPAPASILPRRKPLSAPGYDIVMAGDFRLRTVAARLAGELDALAGGGRRVAICQLESCRREVVGKEPLADEIQAILDSGRVARVFIDQPARCRLLLVRCPLVLHYAQARVAALRPAAVRVIADVAPSLLEGQASCYEVARCAGNAAQLFGHTAMWMAGSPAVRAALAPHVPASLLLPECWEGRWPMGAGGSMSGERQEALVP